MDKEHILLLARPGAPAGEIAGLLKESGYQCTVSETPAGALKAVVSLRPRAVLIYQPDSGDGDGFGPGEYLEIAAAAGPVPCVLLSSSEDSDLYLRALSNGINRCIMLPCGKRHFIERIEAAMNRSGGTNAGGGADSVHGLKELAAESLCAIADDTIRGAVHKNDLLKKCIAGHMPLHKSLVGGASTAAFPVDTGLYRECKTALANGQFLLHYQPIVSLEKRKISGFEALIRWSHPRRGLVSPAEFLPTVENSDLIVPVGFWVIQEACRQIGLWQEKFISEEPLSVSINVSARQFIHHELAEDIAAIVRNSGVSARTIRFEITESAFMDDMEASNLMLLKLKAENFLLYMDDFGTGYSSLAYLKHFPVDVLKIDQSFVKYMHIDDESEIIVKAVIGLAHNLEMEVVGEGVETAEHLALLKEFGCDYGQGYLFSPPLSPADMTLLLEKDQQW